MSEERETTHIRITKELKQELQSCDGYNFTERIRSYAGQDSCGKQNVNTDELVEKLESELELGLTKSDVRQAVEEALPSGLY